MNFLIQRGGRGLWILGLVLGVLGCARPPAQEPGPAVGEGTGPAVQEGGAGRGGEAAGVIKLGSFMCNTGSFATFGQSTTKAMKLAVEEVNAAGGVLGKPLELIVEDDQCKPEEAANAVRKLIDQDQVVVVVGEVASSNSLAAAPICQAARIPMLTPSSTNPEVTRKGDFIFRACFIDTFQGAVMAHFAVEHLKAKTAALLGDVNSDYSQGLIEFFTKKFEALGGRVVATESYMQNDKDFKTQLTKLKALKPDVVFVPGYYNEVSLIVKQARELGLTMPFIGGDGWDSPKLVEIGGQAVEGCYFSNHYSKDEDKPEVQRFVQTFQEKYGEVPDALAACGYDAIRLVADAIQRAGSTDPQAIRDALAKTKDFPGVTGTITIDADRNARKSAVVLTIRNGQQEYVTTITPAQIEKQATPR